MGSATERIAAAMAAVRMRLAKSGPDTGSSW
jgi:hypothetical protein